MITIIQGPAGSGKSTLARALSEVSGAVLRDEHELGCVDGFDPDENVIFVLRPGQKIRLIDLSETTKENA